MDLTGISNYTNYLVDANTNETEELKRKLSEAADSEVEDEKLLDACKQFESYLWEQIMKGMEKTIKPFGDDEEEHGYAGGMVDYFKGNMYQELAKQITSEGTGPNSLAQLLYNQMKRNSEAVTL